MFSTKAMVFLIPASLATNEEIILVSVVELFYQIKLLLTEHLTIHSLTLKLHLLLPEVVVVVGGAPVVEAVRVAALRLRSGAAAGANGRVEDVHRVAWVHSVDLRGRVAVKSREANGILVIQRWANEG